MTMEEAREDARRKANVMLAFADGKQVESRWLENYDWVKRQTHPWNWQLFDYRVETEPLTLWIVFKSDGYVYEAYDNESAAKEAASDVKGWYRKMREEVE